MIAFLAAYLLLQLPAGLLFARALSRASEVR